MISLVIKPKTERKTKMSEEASNIIGTTGSVFGIDLGTTFSAIAYLNEAGEPQTISNTKSSKVTPSVVYVQENVPDGKEPEILIGETALSKEAADPTFVHRLFKRRFGDANADVTVNGKPWSPTDFSAALLKGMVEDAKVSGFNVHDVVITHPAYFSPDDIEATKRAGEQAGLNVLQMLPEPVAAALFYGIRQSGQTKTIAVYDLGGGTFDATLVRIEENSFQILDFDGRKTLGGADWDQKIIDWCIDQAVEESGISRESITDDADAMAELRAKAVQAKIDLSDTEVTKVVFTAEDGRHKIELTREKFEELTKELLTETRDKMDALLRKAAEGNLKNLPGERIERVDDFLLVGGSTKMPQVMKMVKENFAQYCANEPMFCDVNEAVAKGAALKALALDMQAKVKDITTGIKEKDPTKTQQEAEAEATKRYIDSSSLAPTVVKQIMGIETGGLASRSFGIVAYINDVQKISNLIIMKTKLPCENEDTFGLRNAIGPSGGKLSLQVYSSTSEDSEVEMDATDKNLKLLSDKSVDLPPNLAAGSPIRVRFSLSKDGMLSINSVDEKGNVFTADVDVKDE